MQQSFPGIPGIGSVGGGASSLPSIGSIGGSLPSPLSPSNVTEEQGDSFGSMLSGAMNQVNTTMTTAKDMTTALISGRLDNLHEMSIAGQKSEIMMKLTTSITGKLAQATTQLFQMQI